MSKPYFYIIRHKQSGKFYAGIEISNPDSLNFLTETGYQTSSKIVKAIISNEGLTAFEIIRIRHFETRDETLRYEQRFLSKVDAKNNPRFLNQHNGGGNWTNKGGYTLSESARKKMSKPKSVKTKNRMSKPKSKDHAKNIGIGRTGIKYTEEGKINCSKAQKERFEESGERKKISDSLKEYFANNPVSEDKRQVISEKYTGKGNPMFGKTQSETTKEKMRLAWKKRKEKAKNSQSSDIF